MVMSGRSQAVIANATADTSRVMSRRRRSAAGPPRHSHSTRSCVVYIASM